MILITGATGNVGRELVTQLAESGHAIRLFTRDAAKLVQWKGRAEIVTGSYDQPDTFARAAEGVDAIFLMNAGLPGNAFQLLLEGTKQKGVKRVVLLSTILVSDPESEIGALHKAQEDTVRASGLECAFLRPGGFMSNTYQWIGSIRADSVVYSAFGEGRFPPIAPEDIAAAAAALLTAPTLERQVCELTGGELITAPQQVSILSRVLGKPIECREVPIETAVENMVRNGVPRPIAASVGKSFQAVREGRGIAITDTVERLTGRKPITFETWAAKHAASFA